MIPIVNLCIFTKWCTVLAVFGAFLIAIFGAYSIADYTRLLSIYYMPQYGIKLIGPDFNYNVSTTWCTLPGPLAHISLHLVVLNCKI